MKKIAVDEAAKKYWVQLYGKYGEALVRDIPRRIKAALVADKKVASVNEDASLMPLAHADSGDGVIIEGLYKDSSSKLMFMASIDNEGNVKTVKSFQLK